MTDITIPPEALRAARAAFMNARGDGDDQIRTACLAMLKHWPGMWHINAGDFEGKIILPLPKEASDE